MSTKKTTTKKATKTTAKKTSAAPKKKATPKKKICRKGVGGRPTKIKDFIAAFEEFLSKDLNLRCLIYTERELVFLVNDELRKKGKETIGYSTFRNYKSTSKYYGSLQEEFLALHKRYLLSQKENIITHMLSGEKGWQRFAWLLERKFSEMNIRESYSASLAKQSEEGDTIVKIGQPAIVSKPPSLK